MARPTKALPTPADDGFNPARLEEANEAAKQLGALQQGYEQGRDLVNQLLGQAQAFQAAGDLLRTFGVSKLAIVKENKLYQQLAGARTPNGSELKGTWVEFCSLLGISDDKANQDIANLQAFGEEALEQMQRVGIGYRDLRQFRKMPSDQRAALIEAAKEGDKDTLLELAEDLIAKHAKEKEALTQRAEAAEADLEARGEVLEGKNRKIDELTESLAKAQRRVKALPPAEVADELRKEVTQMAGMAEVGILALRSGLAALAEHAETHGANHEDFTAGLICQLELAIKQLRGEFDIKARPDGDDTPEWARPGAEARIKEATAAAMAENGWAFDASGKMVPAELAKKGWELDAQGRMVAAGTVAEA
ncbi:hypothetical protein [Rhodocyclus tenuis]|uniref:Uncharacterized protein n=1 Tax=Rhodocyclus tenuis TaxID=1066 RepID=A0A840GE94_RHOTE|nr:hypothetical protein [Rhodocyclus tenuis]MBB4246539.1 hypothetical protein [Rhodocyclus tenuis]